MKVANLTQFRSLATNKKFSSLRLASTLAIVFLLTLLGSPTTYAQTFSIIYNFQGGPFDGFWPWAGVTIKGNALYGTTREGGADCGEGHSCGTVYQLSHVGSDWVESLIYRFPTHPSGGIYPLSRVVFGPDGHLYGTANQAFNTIYGVVYQLVPPASLCKTAACFWNATELHSFTSDNGDGAYPYFGDLIWDQQGNFYGTTQMGGNCCGTVFQMSKSGNNWTETPIYQFTFADGCLPESGVVMDGNGNLFGTTTSCTANSNGSVYELTYDPQAGWKETTLYSFTGGSDGGVPYAGLILDGSGNLFGATSTGTSGATIFELSPSGNTYTFKVIYQFAFGLGGPYANLTLDTAGNLYGTTHSAGSFKQGNIFKLTNTANGWVYTSLHDFTGGDDGGSPFSNVSIDTDGTLYGTASQGGSHKDGVVWMIKP